jgi:hypothetical protein
MSHNTGSYCVGVLSQSKGIQSAVLRYLHGREMHT